MSWINEHKSVGRVAVLMLLLVAIMGPWTYSADGAPPAEWCHDPFILLENGRCVGLMSGATILTFMARAFLSMSVGLVTGVTVFADRAGEFLREFLFTMVLFPLVLPFFSTLLLIRGGDPRRRRVFHLTAWGLAALSALPLLMSASELPPGQLWGIWLYIGLAASALTLESLALVAGRRPSQG
ncbi:MAG: hypothetical protein E3J21_03745 [Anaerolineales bacterium]|nr:MAG: hypothetical protein E3J21_03745 [Anaerolineales bacterium]